MDDPEAQRWIDNAERGIRDLKPNYVLASSTGLKRLNRRDLAEKILREALDVFKENVQVFRELATIIIARNPEEGLNFANEYVGQFRLNARFQRAIALSKLERNREAINEVETIIDQDRQFKKDRFVIVTLWALYNHEGQFEKARDLLQPLIDDGTFTDTRMKQELATTLIKLRKDLPKVLELLKNDADPRSTQLKQQARDIMVEVTVPEVPPPPGNVARDTIFVIYGRNENARKALFQLLRAAGLKPLEWDQALRLTRKGTPYIGEVIDAGLGAAQAAIVLFTGDDLAVLRGELLSPGERVEEPLPQPRPNVILEAGIALGRNPDRTIIVQLGEIRKISDLLGRHVVELDNSLEKRKALLTRLETAGCVVNMTGNDWMSAGDFSEAIV